MTPERLAEYEHKAGYLNGLYWDTEEDGLDVKTLIAEFRTLQQQNKTLLEGMKWYASESEEAARAFHFGSIKSDIGQRARIIVKSMQGGDTHDR